MLLTCLDPDGIERRILIDTGSDRDSLIRNAKLLKVDLGGIDAVILSRSHPDHTATTVEVAHTNPGIRIYAHPSAFDDWYYVNEKEDRHKQSPTPNNAHHFNCFTYLIALKAAEAPIPVAVTT